MTEEQKKFIDMIGSAAVAHYGAYGILPSLTIAQAILESGWGKSALARECFNYFGMKWTKSCGCAYKQYDTKEQKSGGEEEDSGFSDFSLSLDWTKNGTPQSGSIGTGLEYGGASGDMCSNFQLSIDSNSKKFGEYSGLYIFNLYLGSNANISDYTITQLWIRDKYGNTNEYTGSDLNSIAYNGISIFSITGDSSGDDFISPVLNSYTIVNPSVSRPGTLKIQLDVFEEGAGFSDFSISLSWQKGNTPQSGSIGTGLEYGGASGDMCSNFQISLDSDSKQFGEKSGIYIFNIDMGEKTNISEYTITELWIRDKSGNETRYNSEDLPTICTNNVNMFSVTGDASGDDVDAPIINSFEILNSTVNRPGVLKLKINITEEGSGLSDIDLTLSWLKNDVRKSGSISTGLEYGGASGDMCSNFNFWNTNNQSNFGGKSGDYIFTLVIGEKADLSTYSIDRIWIRDKYGNTTEIGSYSYSEDNDITDYSVTGTNTFVLQDEFNYSFSTGTNNPNLAQRLNDMPEGMAAKVEITGDNTLSQSCLDAIKGKDKTIVAYSTDIQWIIKGEDITGTTKDLNLAVSVSQISSGNTFTNASTNGDVWTLSDDSVKLEFYPNGKLPGQVQVRFKSDTLYDKGISGNTPSLYYFDNEAITLENSDSDLNFDGTDKWCYVKVTHNSTFAVSNTTNLQLKKQAITATSDEAGTSPSTDESVVNGNSTPCYVTAVNSIATSPENKGITKEVVNTNADGTASIKSITSKKKSITIGSTVTVDGVTYTITTIEKNAFKNCKKAKTIKLPSTITTIKKGAFSGAKKLKTVKLTGKKAITVKKGAFKGLDTTKMTIKLNKKMSKKEFKKMQKNLTKAGFKGTVKKG